MTWTMALIEKDEIRALNSNLAQFQIDTMRRYGDSVALIDANTGTSYKYSDVILRIQRLAAGLHDVGLRQGDVLAILTFNNIDYHVIWYATNLLGATFQTLAPSYTDDDLLRRFNECKTNMLITTSELTGRIQKLLLPKGSSSVAIKPTYVRTIIAMGQTGAGVIPYQGLFSEKLWTSAAPVDPARDTAILLSSSGTTGLPKNVQLTHRNIACNSVQWSQVTEHKPGDCQLIVAPMFHHYASHCIGGIGLYQGLKNVVMERFDVIKVMDVIRQYQVNILPIVPPMANRLVKCSGGHSADLSSVKHIQCAAASLGIEAENQLKKMFGLTYIARAYGLTETGISTGNNNHYNRSGSSGKNAKSIKIKIIDPETERVLPAYRTGEIRLAGPQTTNGYLNKEEATRAAYDKEGFFKTGDLGYLDADGFLFFVGRLKELIKYNAFQVAPAYLEDLLLKIPDIVDAAVIGVPDQDAGELPKAFVVRRPNSKVTSDDISRYVEARVASYMRLRGGVEVVETIPRTASGKILRRLLRERTAHFAKL